MQPVLEKYHYTVEQITDEDKEIRAAIKDISRFSVLYDRYYVLLFRYIYNKIDSEEDAADITSEVFLNVMLHLKRYQFKGLPFVSWLYRMASNEIIMRYRKNQITRVFNANTEYLQQIANEIDENRTEENMQLLESALGTLHISEMELIELRYFEKRSFSEIGEIKGITENYSKLKVHRIIQKLKDKIKNDRS